ncbi:MAG: ureidoglycolate lyase, partial [Pseudomonadota bacterium]
MLQVTIAPLTVDGFAPYGDVIEFRGKPDKIINQGRCGRYHDMAHLDFGDDGRGGISLFHAKPQTLPLQLDMMECHPDGTQAFLPMTQHPFLVVVARDVGGQPGLPRAFKTAPGQGVNYHRGVWHAVLTPLA